MWARFCACKTVQGTNQFNDIFSSARYDEWKSAFRFTKTCLVYGWATKLASSKTNKQKKSVQGSKGVSMATWWKEEATKHRAGKKDEHIGRLLKVSEKFIVFYVKISSLTSFNISRRSYWYQFVFCWSWFDTSLN